MRKFSADQIHEREHRKRPAAAQNPVWMVLGEAAAGTSYANTHLELTNN